MTNPQEGLTPYGPGKYTFLVDSYIDQNFEPDEEWGSISENGLYVSLFRGPFNPTAKQTKDLGLNKTDLAYLRNYKFGVLLEDDQGFVTVTDFSSLEEACLYFESFVEEEEE